MNIADFLLGVLFAGSFTPRPARPKIAPPKKQEAQTAYTGGANPATWDSAETNAREAEQLAHDMGVLDVDHFGVLRGMTKTVQDVKNGDDEVFRQRVNWKG